MSSRRALRFAVVLVSVHDIETLATFAHGGDAYAYGFEASKAPAFDPKWDTIQTRTRSEVIHVWPIKRPTPKLHPRDIQELSLETIAESERASPIFGRSAPRVFDPAHFKDSIPCDSCRKRGPCGCDRGM